LINICRPSACRIASSDGCGKDAPRSCSKRRPEFGSVRWLPPPRSFAVQIPAERIPAKFRSGEHSALPVSELGGDDGLEREFSPFKWLEGGVCTMCAPRDQRKSNNSYCARRWLSVDRWPRIAALFTASHHVHQTDANYSTVAKGGITSGINPSPASAAQVRGLPLPLLVKERKIPSKSDRVTGKTRVIDIMRVFNKLLSVLVCKRIGDSIVIRFRSIMLRRDRSVVDWQVQYFCVRAPVCLLEMRFGGARTTGQLLVPFRWPSPAPAQFASKCSIARASSNSDFTISSRRGCVSRGVMAASVMLPIGF
jgi:hypothetical protein